MTEDNKGYVYILIIILKTIDGMLNFVIENTNRFIASVSKSKRKQYGQFFTSKRQKIRFYNVLHR